MNFDTFFSTHSNDALREPVTDGRRAELGNDALFQLPLIALAILVLAKDKRKPKVSELGQFIGETLEGSMPGFKGSSQQLGWSATLRIRTVTALNFLEYVGLVFVENDRGRINISDLGKKVVIRATTMQADDLAYNLSQIERTYRNICVARQLDLQIT